MGRQGIFKPISFWRSQSYTLIGGPAQDADVSANLTAMFPGCMIDFPLDNPSRPTYHSSIPNPMASNPSTSGSCRMVEFRSNNDIARVFVGRQREMAELTSALNDALSGQGRLVMLAGEPGIGKTRTAQELGVLAEQRGAQILWGRCHEEEGAPPYWPWVQSMRAYVQQTAPEQLAEEMGLGAAAIGEIIAEIRGKLPGAETPPALEPEAARFRLFDSISTFLKNVAQRQPLMVVLDDLHWADRSSLLLLEFVAREIGISNILLVGAYRDVEVSRRHPLSQTLGALVREQLFHRVQLDGLTQQEVGELVEDSAGINLTLGAAEIIHKRTDGNPFFVGEVTRHVTLENITEDPGWVGVIPEGVRDAIGRRLNRLSEQCNQMLTTASVVGREFEFRLLISLMNETTEDQLLAAMDEAVGAHLIEELPQSVGRYQFTHALVRETISEELSNTRRVRLHARIGEVLEELYGEDTDAHAAELSHHFAQAETVLGSEKLVHYSLMAGEQALAAYSYEEALTHFEVGLAARDISLSGTEAPSDGEAADLLFGLARAKSATGVGDQRVDMFATLSRAFDYYVQAGNVARAVAAAEFPIANPSFRIPGDIDLMNRALSLVSSDSHEAGRLLSRYGGMLGAADYEGAQQALGQALSIARREEDVPLEVQTLTYAATVSGNHLHNQESVDNGLRALELATGDGYIFTNFTTRWWITTGLLRMSNLDAARVHALVLRDLAERPSTPRLLASSSFAPITALSCLEGDWNAGREYSDRGLELLPMNRHHLWLRALLEHETGESAQGEMYLERLLEAARGVGPISLVASHRALMAITAVARITGIPDRLEIAEEAAKTVLSEQSVRPIDAMQAKAALALLAVQKGDENEAVDLYDDLLDQRGTMIWTLSSVDRLLGLLAQTKGDVEHAEAHFEDALGFCRKAGYGPELAWSCCDYADCLLQRNRDGDRAKAIFLLDESLSISTELGMQPLMERVADRMGRVQAQPSSAPAYPDGLTQREVEVLRLVAVGKSNADIAEELVISPNTVVRHVSSILAKTGSSNRTEAALYASQNGLTG